MSKKYKNQKRLKMQEILSPVTEAEPSTETSELPLGAALDQNQLDALRGFAIDNFKSYWAGVETKEEFAGQLESYGEGYTPELGISILKAIGSTGSLKGVDNEVTQLQHVAQDEAGFQAVLAGSVLHGYGTALGMPEVYKAIAGATAFEAEIDETIEKAPNLILSHIRNLSTVLGEDSLNKKVTAAYRTISQNEKKHLHPYEVSRELMQIIGQERLSEDVRKEIATGDFFVGKMSLDMVRNIAKLELISADEALAISLDALRKDQAFLNTQYLEDIVALSEDPTTAWKQVQDTVLAIVDDPDASEAHVADVAQSFSNEYRESYDQSFALKLLNGIKDVRGPLALLGVVSLRGNKELIQELVDKGVAEVLQAFNEGTDERKRGEFAKALVPISEEFDVATRQELIRCYAENDPYSFLFSWALKPGEGKTDAENEFLRENALSAIEKLDSSQFMNCVSDLRNWFSPSDPRLREAVLAKSIKLDDLGTGSGLQALMDIISKEELEKLFVRMFADSEDSWVLQSTFSSATKVFGFEEAKSIFADQIRSKPDLALGLIRNNQMMLSDEELSELIQVIVDNDKLYRLMSQLDHLAYRLPRPELVNLLEAAVNASPRLLLGQLKSLSGVLDEATTSRLIDAVMRQNPALVLSSLKQLPEGIVDGADEVIAFMKSDERTALAPKYFHKMMKQLPKVEDTTAFIILSREAQRVYAKLNKVLSMDEGKGSGMLMRIKDTIGTSSERGELDSISFASLMAIEGVDPETIQTVDDAKRNTVVTLNKRLGSELDPARFAELEQKLGSLVPISMYSLLINDDMGRAYQENGKYLKEVISQLDSGYYRMWRYGDRAELINEKVIPEVTQSQYAAWQQVVSVESADIVADDAASVAQKIQEVIARGLLENNTIQKLSNLEDPTASLDDIRTELSTAGARISEIHRMKKAGKLSDEDATAQVTELQNQMSELDLAMNVVRLSHVTPAEVTAGVLFNESGRPTRVTIDNSLNQIVERYGTEAMEAFGQLQTVLENFREAATTDIGNITVSDVDDFQTTFEIGANPVGSCQHYELGQQNVGLPGYFEPSVKIITVRNEKNRLVARAIVRLAADDANQPVMVLEPVYTSQASNDIEDAIKTHAKTKANSMGIQLLREEKGGRKDIHLPEQRAPVVYSDVFGGIREKGISWSALPRDGLVPVE
jgi:hypothetical protein